MSFDEFMNCISVKNVKKAYTDFDVLISRDELMNIYTGMNREYDFCDASKILMDVCQRKREHPNKYLSSIKLIKSYETCPPIRTYDYNFTENKPIIEGSVNPGKYDEPIFSGTCLIL